MVLFHLVFCILFPFSNLVNGNALNTARAFRAHDLPCRPGSPGILVAGDRSVKSPVVSKVKTRLFDGFFQKGINL